MKLIFNPLLIFSLLLVASCSHTNNNTIIDEGQSVIEYPNPKSKTVLMCKAEPWELRDTIQWQTTYSNIDVFKFYIGGLSDTRYSLEEKQQFIKVLQDKKIKIAVELGGLLSGFHDSGSQAAELSFQSDMKKIEFLVKPISEGGLGATLDMIDMDGPLRRILFPDKQTPSPYQNIELAIGELLDVVALWKDKFPQLKVNYLVNFPNWGWKGGYAYLHKNYDGGEMGYGDFSIVLSKIITQATARGVKIDALTIDNPYDYATGQAASNQSHLIQDIDWIERIKELEVSVKNEGWDVNLIFNSSSGGKSSNENYYNDTMSYIELYENNGGNPDGYWVQSWYPFPSVWMPETTSFTMTNLTNSVLKKVKN